MTRSEARQGVFQRLFEMDMQKSFDIKDMMRYDLSDFQIRLLETFIDNREAIDDKLSRALKDWKLDTLGKVELACLRLAVTEMYYVDDVPNAVAINESIELAKTFGDEKTPKFVNGVLRTVSDDH